MAKAYWIATYFSISNPDALAEYAKLAGPAITASGGRFLARGNAAKAYEKGLRERVVLIEFDSVEKATAAHDSPAYQAALELATNERERAYLRRRLAELLPAPPNHLPATRTPPVGP